MSTILALIGSHGTKILGGLIASVSFLSGSGIIPPGQLKYYTVVLGLLTIWRGIFTGNAYTQGVSDGLAGMPLPPFQSKKAPTP
jgi:hypothetical protein